jgi:predicted membrane protein
LHRYISFGSDNPQLCFRYTLTDKLPSQARSLVINQKFVFNLNWNPDDFAENETTSVEDLVSAGELDLF